MDINSLIEQAKTAIFYVESKEAKKLLKKIESFIASNNLKQNDPELLKKLEQLVIYLKIVAFSNLTDEESAKILREHYLESFEIEVSMENNLVVKLFLEPIVPRDNLRKKLKKALAENQQQLGPLTLSQWIVEFEKAYDVHTRKPSSIVEFSISNSNARKLNQTDQNKLKKILRTYDYLLVSTIPTTEPELSIMLENLNPNDTVFENSSAKTNYTSLENFTPEKQKGEGEMVTKNLLLSEALEKFPDLGEQLITSNHLKLKSFPTPVRPSIKNWLSDYTFTLGYESHSAMDRGTYLFKNENAKILNSLDRERISYVLKAYDENSPIEINTNTKQLIFPKKEVTPLKNDKQKTTVNNPEPADSARNDFRTNSPTLQRNNFQEVYNTKKQENQPKDIFEKEKEATENRQPTNLNFSSPQKLPYEKRQPASIENFSHNSAPLRISSQSLRNENDGDENESPQNNRKITAGNIVNLKDSK